MYPCVQLKLLSNVRYDNQDHGKSGRLKKVKNEMVESVSSR